MTAFFQELKRRRVVRAAVVYAAAAFVILQVADLLAGGLRLPDWVFPTITVLVVIGFPLALVLAWTFDITAATPDAERTDAVRAAAAPAWLGRGTLLVAGALVGIGIVLATGWVVRPIVPSTGAGDAAGSARTYVVSSIRSDAVDVRMVTDRFAVSPDGSAVVMVGLDRSGEGGLLLRRPGQLEAVRITGTHARSISPVFSPDGRWVAYIDFGTGALMKAPVADGAPVRLAVTGGGGRLTWGADDRIRLGLGARLLAVHASSGAVDTLAFGGDTTVWRGVPLPRERLLLSLVIADTLERIVVRERNGQLRQLLDGFDARIGDSGHLVFVRREGDERVLMAAALDLRSARLRGELITLQRGVPAMGATPAALTASGDLVYLAGVDRADRRIVLLDRRGLEREIAGADRPWLMVRPSPDGSQLATVVWQQGGRRIWTVAVATGAMTPVTRTGDALRPRWLPDGASILFTDIHEQARFNGSLLRVPADGSAPPDAIATLKNAYVFDVSSDGRLLIFGSSGRAWLLPLHPDSAARPLLPASLDESAASLSPDGRLIAFTAAAAGRTEVRIGPTSNPGSAVSITRAGATLIGWSRDGRFFYRIGDEVWQLRPGAPDWLTGATRAFTLPRDVVWSAVMPDGERIALIRGGDLYTDLIMVEGAFGVRARERSGSR